VTDAPVPVVPSPKFQVTVYGTVPPSVVDVKVTGMLTMGFAETVRLVDRGTGPEGAKNSVIADAAASFAVKVGMFQTVSRVFK